eukprot:6199405-Pleurochrysis_carterae.AAC.3
MILCSPSPGTSAPEKITLGPSARGRQRTATQGDRGSHVRSASVCAVPEDGKNDESRSMCHQPRCKREPVQHRVLTALVRMQFGLQQSRDAPIHAGSVRSFSSIHASYRRPSICRNSVPGVMQFESNGDGLHSASTPPAASNAICSGTVRAACAFAASRRACCLSSRGTR